MGGIIKVPAEEHFQLQQSHVRNFQATSEQGLSQIQRHLRLLISQSGGEMHGHFQAMHDHLTTYMTNISQLSDLHYRILAKDCADFSTLDRENATR